MSHILRPDRYEAAIKRNIRMNAAKTANKVWKTVEDHAELERFMEENLWNDFVSNLWGAFLDYGKLTPNQCAALRKTKEKIETNRAKKDAEIAAKKLEDAKGNWISGDIKERKVFDLNIEKVLSFESEFGYVYIHLCKIGADTVVYKGSKVLGSDGDTITVKATIKAFDVRDGVKQTIIARPAFIKGE